MTLTRPAPLKLPTTRSLLESLIAMPDVEHRLQALPPSSFAALVRKVGVEDAGELVALATTEQLVQAFDEDLFVSEQAGEREVLDAGRFAVWLQVLLEAGDEVAANRIAQLDEDFVAHALSSSVLVLDEEALRQRLDEVERDEALEIDKALESALAEDLDGYLLIAKQHEGWDAVLALILALDRDHRALLVRLLDRLAAVSSSYLDDLEELSTVLTQAESLAEDVEAAREERRSKQGYVEPRAARAFLTLARRPLAPTERAASGRDALTRAYFRELERNRPGARAGSAARGSSKALTSSGLLPSRLLPSALSTSPTLRAPSETPQTLAMFQGALQELSETAPAIFSERMDELVYLANVLLAGHERDGLRMNAKAAADAVLATVCFGATLELHASHAHEAVEAVAREAQQRTPTRAELAQIMRELSADFLFRVASSALASGAAAHVFDAQKRALLDSAEELEAALR